MSAIAFVKVPRNDRKLAQEVADDTVTLIRGMRFMSDLKERAIQARGIEGSLLRFLTIGLGSEGKSPHGLSQYVAVSTVDIIRLADEARHQQRELERLRRKSRALYERIKRARR